MNNISKDNIEQMMICARGLTYELETLFRKIEYGQEIDYNFRLNLCYMYYRSLNSMFVEVIEKEINNEKN